MRCKTKLRLTTWVRMVLSALACATLVSVAAMAQSKYSGPTLNPTNTPSKPAPPVDRQPVTSPDNATPPANAEADGAARSLAARLPLDPATRDLRNRLPADVPGTIRRLGLREPHGSRVDLSGRTPTPKEIADALAH